MAAVTRWVKYDTTASGVAGLGRSQGGKGTRAVSIGTADPGDEITIGPTTNRLHISMDGDSGPYVTLYSGSALDPRFVARDITEKMHNLGKADERWDHAVCKWENVTIAGTITKRNRFKIYSGTLGSASSVTVVSGSNTAVNVLGFNTKSETGGSATSNAFDGTIGVTGAYYGFFDETYSIVISNDDVAVRGIGTATKGGSNTYAGTMTTGGVFNNSSGDTTYVIETDVTNGTTMGAGTGNVPRMKWTGTGGGGDTQTDWTELLYPDFWYNVGKYGLMVKFTDAVFNTVDPAWTIVCSKPDFAEGSNASAAVGTAEFVWSSDRGDMSGASRGTTSSGATRVGTRGLYINFVGGNSLAAGDEFFIICKPPEPASYNITSLNYGNVTVSTESSLRAVMFEIESGATQMSTVKFGLQSNGTFSHHNAGNSDTYFRFGTIGPANNAGGSPMTGQEWRSGIAATDIDNDVPPSYLYATEDNLSVVATADNSESVGNYPLRGMTADPMWLNIRLGASETGANSTINYRCYFDYS